MWSLDCFTVDDYLAWCAARGFRADTKKSPMNLSQELACHRKEIADRRLQQSRIARKPIKVIAAVCEGKIECDDIASAPLREVCARINAASLAKRDLLSLRDFLTEVWRVSKLPVQSERQNYRQLNYIDALMAVHRLRRRWIRPVDRWRPQSHNRQKQFHSLVRHLLVSYEVPAFFESVWFRTDASAAKYQRWYVDLGTGSNPRQGPVPIPLTRKAAHYFLQAPAHYGIEEAVRFGQIRSLGGSLALCNAINETRLGTEFANDEFWQSVIRFFVRNPALDMGQVGPIVDFIQHHKYERQQVFLAGGETRWLPPPRPNLSMQRRTLHALLAQVEEWHRRLGKVEADASVRFSPSGIRPAVYKRGKDAKQVIWRISELLSHKELVREGNALKHCVATYSRQCRDGDSSIWSMTSEDACGIVRRRQTIEVRRHRRIVQCRGRMNNHPNEQERQIVRTWAEAESLNLCLHGF